MLVWRRAEAPTVRFVDIAAQAGLTVPNTFGGKEKKESILESTGTGAAIFDFDGDGANDIFIANGPPSRSSCTATTARGHFTEVGAASRTDAHRMGAGGLRGRYR